MSDAATALTNPPPSDGQAGAEDGADHAPSLADRQLELLGRLAEAGLEVALAVERRAKAAGPDDDLNGVAMAYARVARAVRLTVMLQTRLVSDRQLQDKLVKIRSDTAWAVASEERREIVERVVGRVVLAEQDDPDKAERLVREAAERLDGDDIYGDLMARPVSEIVASVCRDLGVDPQWTRLAEEAWARDEMAGEEVGAPLAALAAEASFACRDGIAWLDRSRSALFPAASREPPAPA